MNSGLKKTTLFLFCLSMLLACRTHLAHLPIQSMSVDFSGGFNYPKTTGKGNFELKIDKPDSLYKGLSVAGRFNAYCPLSDPVQLTLIKKEENAVLSDLKGHEFILGRVDDTNKKYDYNSYLIFDKKDKVSFTSSIGLPYWHGFNFLGGLPLFMRYHYYTFKIKKPTGESLKLQWKYSVYKYKGVGNKKVWSGDYCEDSGGGLTQLKIN